MVLSACVVSETRPVEYQPAVNAQVEIPSQQLLSVAIVELDPGLPEAEELSVEEIGVPADVRRAESRFIDYHLKKTLEQTSECGAVRVIPQPREGS